MHLNYSIRVIYNLIKMKHIIFLISSRAVSITRSLAQAAASIYNREQRRVFAANDCGGPRGVGLRSAASVCVSGLE